MVKILMGAIVTIYQVPRCMINLVVIRYAYKDTDSGNFGNCYHEIRIPREYLQVQTPMRMTIEIANMLIIKPLQCLMLRSTQKLAYPFQTS